MITINQDSENSSLVDNQFIDRVMNILTLYNSLPYKIPRLMIIECIKTAARYFYTHYPSAWRQSFIYITPDEVNRSIGKNHFETNGENGNYFGKIKNNEPQIHIKLSPRVRVVEQIFEAGDGSSNIFVNDLHDDFSGEFAMIGGNQYGNRAGISSIDRHLYLLEMGVKHVELSAIPSMIGVPFNFRYNVPSKILTLKSRPKTGLLLKVFIDVEINQLYNDSYFERYVIALCKRELKRLIGSHTIQLPGDVTLNVDEVTAGIDDIEKIEETLKNMSGVGDVILRR